MKILIVMAHPEPKSFNGAMLQKTVETFKKLGHEVKVSDLYQMNFNPVSGKKNFKQIQNTAFFKQQSEETYASEHSGFADDVLAEQEKVEWCDLMIWQFPLWWFALPAILKGWVDKVFAMGKFYGGGKIYETGVCKGKKAMLSLTTGGPEASYVKNAFNGDIDAILRPIHRGIFQFLGFSVLKPEINYSVAHLSETERIPILDNWVHRLETIFEEPEIEVGEY